MSLKKAVVIYSGGMDSRTVLEKAIHDDYDVHALSFNYGQRHSVELEYARRVTDKKGIIHKIIDITSINDLLQGSSLTGDIDIPEGHYEEESMKSTVVPNRNMIMLSLAIAYAVSIGTDKVYYGAHAGDHAIYPDCRPEFLEKMNSVAAIANYEAVNIYAPYLDGNKETILQDGFQMGVDYADTWTCYNGRKKACGKCGACQERLEAFKAVGRDDPLMYE
jgi:7-cyano-7-deazaguanine synthase